MRRRRRDLACVLVVEGDDRTDVERVETNPGWYGIVLGGTERKREREREREGQEQEGAW